MSEMLKPRLVVVAGLNGAGNSMERTPARLLFRTSGGKLIKRYGEFNPWASEVLREINAQSTH